MTHENYDQGNFDLDAWQTQGKQALSDLQGKKASLLNELDEINNMISKIEDALGGSRKPRRVRIRPSIVGALKERPGVWMPVDDVVHAVCKEVEGVDVTSVLAAIRRTVREIDNIEESDNNEIRIVAA